jgi:signal transduction histidine kinase
VAIARWIAQAHGGTLELARSDARGSLFVLSLPAGAARC